MSDSSFEFTIVLIIAAFVLIFLVDWLFKRLDSNADERHERRLMKEIRRNAEEQDEKNK